MSKLKGTHHSTDEEIEVQENEVTCLVNNRARCDMKHAPVSVFL